MEKKEYFQKLKASRAGIYIIAENFDENCAYIGKDKHLADNIRIDNHLSSNQKTQINVALKKSENFIYRPLLICAEKDMNYIEKALISYYMPKYNVEYIAKINKRHYSTIKFIKKIKDKYNISDPDMKRLVSIIKLRSL